MGSPANEPDRDNDETQHRVTVSGFYMGRYEVTQKEYQEVMGTNPSNFKGDNLPVERVSWFDAIEYCNARSQKEGLTPAYTISGRTPATGYPITAATVTWNRNANGYRLPTEAEWEYAAKGGADQRSDGSPGNFTYAGSNIADEFAWLSGNSGSKTQNVGTKKPNGLGLHDMSGNVYEWCWDWYGSYSSGAQTDPLGASSGSFRVVRGGGWGYPAGARSADRRGNDPNGRGYNLGFRVARNG
jgi:formylglycine-generating enzyme required for sulfatase activity